MGTGSSKKSKEESKERKDSKDKKRRASREDSNAEILTERQPPKGARRSHQGHKTTRSPTRLSKEFVAYEAESLNLEGNWEIEKGIDEETPISDLSYPPARPGKIVTDRSAFITVDFDILQNNNLKLAHGTFEEVAGKLTQSWETELLKVRALTTWISCQKIRTRQYGSEAKQGTVVAYMKKIKQGNGTFAAMLAQLCRSVNIPCIIIHGIYKSACHDVGQDDLRESQCTWNAVHMDGSWQLVHPYLICTPLSNVSPKDDWKLIESSREEPPPRNAAVLNSFFFAPKPQDFAKLCLPEESMSQWQLLQEKVSYTQFIKFPFLRPAFHDSGMQLRSCQNCVVLTEAGMYSIRIQCLPESASDIKLMYELYTLDQDFKTDPDWGDLVLCGRNEDVWNVQVKFPVDGTFKVALFANLYDWFFWIGDVKIVCGEPFKNFVPQPSVPREVGYGPSKLTESAGLLCPSHEGGIVFYKKYEEHIIKFLTTERLYLRYEIENSQFPAEDLRKYCRMIVRKSEIDFVVNLPLRGEFALRIYKLDEKMEATNVCNYLFTDAGDDHRRENVFQRKARLNLREATAGHESEVLEKALDKFDSVKLSHDDDYVRGARRLRYLKLKKGLRDGRMRHHEDTLHKAVDDAVTSPFSPALAKNIEKARAMLADLESLEINSHPVQQMDQKTIAEIANFNNPPRDVHNTMIATYLLLGEKKQYLQRWGNIQVLLHRQGRESIKHRISEFQKQPAPDPATVQAAQRLHDSVPKPYIVSASLSAAAFYDWVSGVLAYLNNTSQNATEAEKSFDIEYSSSVNKKGYHGNTILTFNDIEDSQDEGFLDSHDVDTNSSVRANSHDID